MNQADAIPKNYENASIPFRHFSAGTAAGIAVADIAAAVHASASVVPASVAVPAIGNGTFADVATWIFEAVVGPSGHSGVLEYWLGITNVYVSVMKKQENGIVLPKKVFQSNQGF